MDQQGYFVKVLMERCTSGAKFEYIEVFYNRMRLHSTLGYITRVESEESMSCVAD